LSADDLPVTVEDSAMDAAKTLLVVDDNEITRAGLASVLRAEGYTVVLAGSGQEALEYLQTQEAPGLILLDMIMKDMDGWGLLKRMRADPAFADIPVLIITALGIANEEWARSLGACGFLRKPFDTPDLLAVVRRC